jgi:hypothetical protein
MTRKGYSSVTMPRRCGDSATACRYALTTISCQTCEMVNMTLTTNFFTCVGSARRFRNIYTLRLGTCEASDTVGPGAEAVDIASPEVPEADWCVVKS